MIGVAAKYSYAIVCLGVLCAMGSYAATLWVAVEYQVDISGWMAIASTLSFLMTLAGVVAWCLRPGVPAGGRPQ